jgi:hypothetical protein
MTYPLPCFLSHVVQDQAFGAKKKLGIVHNASHVFRALILTLFATLA